LRSLSGRSVGEEVRDAIEKVNVRLALNNDRKKSDKRGHSPIVSPSLAIDEEPVASAGE
jgi:hypothetical protein